MEKKYIAFISYRHAELDSAVAKTLHTLIEQYRIPRGLQKDGNKRLGIVFRDQEELNASSNLTEEIQHALDNTEYLIVICSKSAIQSPWVMREIEYFLRHHDHAHVLTVLASGEPDEVFPAQLTQSPDGPDAPPIEPLAVDVRADTVAGSCKKLRREIPRLIAALLQCPYDALVMREQKRKTRRITSIAAIVMAVLLGFTSMVLMKNKEIAQVNTQLETKNTELDRANTDLNQANTSLAEQKAAVQLRESQLLAQDAAADLQNADYYGAIEKALAALPQSQEDNRPYHAPAERVLMEAVNVFQPAEASEELNVLQLEQLADVAEFTISQDGTRVVSVDSFGTVCCFDADTGTQLWSQYAALDSGTGTMSNLHVFLCCDDALVIRSTRRQLTAYDLQTGKQIWSTAVGDILKGYLFYQADRNTLVLATAFPLDFLNVTYQITEVSAETGEILQNIPICTRDGNLQSNLAETSTTMLSKAGIFSPDGSQFYGAFFDQDFRLSCIHTDLTKGTATVLDTYDSTYQYSSKIIGMSKLEDVIQIVIQGSSNEILISALSVQADTGRLEWQTDVAPSSEVISYTKDPGSVLFTSSNILIGCYDHYIHIDRQTGKHLHTDLSPDNIIDMTPVSDYNFGITLNDGTYQLGWLQTDNTLMLSSNQLLNVLASLEEPAVSKVWGGGIVQLSTDNDSFQMGVSNFVRPGYVAIIPKGKENTIQIIRPKQAPSFLTYSPVVLPAEDLSASNCTMISVGDHLVAGPFRQRSSNLCYYFMIDPLTQEVTESFSSQESYSEGELFWLPGTLQPLICNYSDGIFLMDKDGSHTQIYDTDAEREELAKEEDAYSSPSLFGNATGYIDGGKTLLTAACTPKALHVWENSSFVTETPLPETLHFPVQDRITKDDFLKIGANGWILVGFYEYDSPIPLKNIAAYNPRLDSWTVLEGEPIFYNGYSITMAKEQDLLAYVDQNGIVTVLDLQTGAVQSQFSTQIPFGSVLKMDFFLDDSCLAIKTSGGYLRIYNLDTGKQLYYDQFTDSYSGTLQIFEDLPHQRLYLKGGSRSGICLDLSNWTALGYPEYLLYYHADSDLVYMSASPEETSPLSYSSIPETSELVQLARDFLSEST